MFERLLVPLDGSERAERALPVAARLARASGGSITLLRIATGAIDKLRIEARQIRFQESIGMRSIVRMPKRNGGAGTPRGSETLMRPMTYQEAFQMLRQAGFVRAEIDRLYLLRRAYHPNELDQAPTDLARLRFARWLVTTGRLTDRLPETGRSNQLCLQGTKHLLLALRGLFPFSSFRRAKGTTR